MRSSRPSRYSRTAVLRSKILKDTLVLNIATGIGQLLSVVQSFLVMRFLVPGALGVWIGLAIVIGYASYGHLGLEYGMGMRLLHYRGCGDTQREAECEDSAYMAWTLIGLMLMMGLAAYTIATPRPAAVRGGLLVIALMVPFEQQTAFRGRWQTASKMDFHLGSYIAVARSLLTFVLFVPLAYFFGVVGIIAGTFVVSATVSVAWWWKSEYRFHWHVSAPMVRELFSIGFPVLLISIGGVLVQTVDRVLVGSRLGAQNLGYYGVTSLGGGLLLGVLSQAGNALGPHIFLEMGRSKGEAESLERYLVKPTLIMSYLAVVGIAILLFVIPLVIDMALPRYRPGIPAVYGFLPGFFFLAIVLTASNVLANVLVERGNRRIMLMVYLQGIAILVEIGLALMFIKMGWSITGVAIASTLSYSVYGCGILYMAAAAVIREPIRRVAFLWQVAVPFVYGVAVVCLGTWLGHRLTSREIPRALIGVSFGALAFVPLTFWLNSQMSLAREFGPAIAGLQSWLLNNGAGEKQ